MLIRYLDNVATTASAPPPWAPCRFSRPAESNRFPLCLESSIGEAVEMVRAIVPAAVAIEVLSDPGLPPVVADAGQIQQVLTNLCVNAAHASLGNGTTFSVFLPLAVGHLAGAQE